MYTTTRPAQNLIYDIYLREYTAIVRQCQQFVNQQKQSSLLKIQGFCVKTRDKILAMLWSTHCQEHIFINSV